MNNFPWRYVSPKYVECIVVLLRNFSRKKQEKQHMYVGPTM